MPSPEVVEIAQRHVRGYATCMDEVYSTNPICADCGRWWPCDTARVLAELGWNPDEQDQP